MKYKLRKNLIEFRKNIEKLNEELTAVLGEKSIYGEIQIDEFDLLYYNCISFSFSIAPTKEEKRKVIKILEKHFGKLVDPHFFRRYKSETDKHGRLMGHTYGFSAYLDR